MKRWSCFLLMALQLPLALLSGCSSGERPLAFNLGVETVQLDWNRAIDANSVVVLDNLMEGLTTYNSEGGGGALPRPSPALAASWSISEEGRVYRFRLRAGVQWTDGQPLDAQQFVDSWERLLRPETRSANAYHLYEIENARAFNEGRTKNFSEVGVRAIEPDLLEVRLRRPVPYFLHLVAGASTFPIRRDLIEKFGEQWTDPANLATLGPYRLVNWEQGERLELHGNPLYRGGLPPIKVVVCHLITEPLAAYALYESGALDILPRDLPPSLLKQLQSHRDFRSGPRLSLSYLLFNTRRAPFHLAANRRAFIEAMNREKLAAFFQGAQAPTSGWVPPGLVGHSESIGIAAKGLASRRLAGQSVQLQYSGSDTWNLVFQDVQRQAELLLGLKARVAKLEGRAYAEFLALISLPQRGRDSTLPHLMQLGWVADYPDPHSFMNVFTSTSESNFAGWSSAEYDQLVEQAAFATDDAQRARLYERAQRILLEDEAVLMPLFYTSHQALVRPELQGVQLNVLDKWYFQSVRFESQGWGGFGRSVWRRLRDSRGSQG